MPAERDELMEHIEALTLAIAARSIPRMLQPVLEVDLTIRQLKTLTVVVTTPDGVTVGDLASAFGVTMATMSKLVDRLVDQALVNRVVDASDQRARRLTATELGSAAVRRLVGARPEMSDDVLGRLSVDELQALEKGLRAIRRELTEA